MGTCYMAPSPIGAYIETFGPFGTITVDDVEARCLSELAVMRAVKLANLTDRQGTLIAGSTTSAAG